MKTPKKWAQWLPWVEFSYNTAFHTSARTSPFEVVYGRPPPTVLPYQNDLSPIIEVDEQLSNRNLALSKLKAKLLRAQQRMTKYGNDKRRDVHFNVYD